MTVMGIEAWVTSAVEEKDVSKALVLAGSLRRVCTAKKLAVLTSCDVSHKLRDKLKRTFDLVVLMEAASPNGLSLEDQAKIEGFSLMLFHKCVYLSPNTMVVKNCDEIFEKYNKFAALENENGMDSSIYLFTPSLDYGKALGKIAHTVEKSVNNGGIVFYQKVGSFAKSLKLWVENNIPNWEQLDPRYNVVMNLQQGSMESSGLDLGSEIGIVNFAEGHPLDLVTNGGYSSLQGMGIVDKFVVELCRKIYLEDVKFTPNMHIVLPLQSQVYKTEPIAIVGMSFRLPGGNNVDEFWDLMINGREAIHLLPKSRWTREHTLVPCQNRNVEAGFLSVPVDEFDPKFFGVSWKEAEFMDPQQRLLHEVAWEALEDAMIDPHSLRGTQTGIFVGSWIHDYKDMLSRATDIEFFRTYMGNSIGVGASRLSHFLETTGPSIGTESGCSSAMVAVDMAVKSLRNHDSNLALACGVNLLLHPFDHKFLDFVLAPDGRCKTFDADANGFGRAEGCAVLLMKRLSNALRDEDKIWGLIRGSASTQEGVSKSLGTPTVHCESLAMELALADADVDPREVSFIETHGTGTPVGDPMEIAAITKAYSKARSEPLVIGSVKTNVGHTESVSGITGIIKVLLSMRNETIPPHLNLKVLNPAINLEAIPAVIPLEAMAWPKTNEKPRIAGVSSFGISGTDGHAIIQEPPVLTYPNVNDTTTETTPRPLHILKISATCPESLQDLVTTYANRLDSNKNHVDDFADLAYSANTGRATFNHRAVVIAKDVDEAAKILRAKSFKQSEVESTDGKLCFLFTGQGSQYPNMAANLYDSSPIFKDHFDKCEQILRTQYGINIREVIWGRSCDGAELGRTLYSQTSIFCIEYCLLKLWESWGVKPDYVMGHSLGEFAAAVAAGALNFEDGLMLVAERSKFIDNLPQGKMLVIGADNKTVDGMIGKYKQVNPKFWVDKAALNSPLQTVLAGDSGMIEGFAKFCGEKSLKTTLLAATHAFHSRHMDPILEAYRKVAETVKPFRAVKDGPKYISGMKGKITDLGSIDADYWVRHAREPVRFVDACKVVRSEGCSIFLEIGPHPVLSALTMMNLEGQSVSCLPSIRRKEDEWVTMLGSLAKLYLSEWKGQIDWKVFDRYYKRTRVSLPFYPFNRKPIWKEMEWTLPDVHPLLGKVFPSACEQTLFEKRLTLKNTPFVLDHVIGNTVVFPGAGFMEMCLSGGHAAAQGTSTSGDLRTPQRAVILKSMKIASPLGLSDGKVHRLQTVIKLDADNNDELSYSVGVHRFIQSTNGGVGEWISHATAQFLPVPTQFTKEHWTPIHVDIPTIQSSWEQTDNTGFYEKLPEVGLRFGPKFRSLQTGWKSESGMLFEVKVPEDNAAGYFIHPIVADAMIQAIMLWTSKDKLKMKLQVPVHIGEFIWLEASTSANRYIYCSTNEQGKTNCSLLDGEGTPLAQMADVDLIETSLKLMEGMLQEQVTVMPKLWKEVWKSSPGTLQSAYDLSSAAVIPFSDQQRKHLVEINDIGADENNFLDILCNMARLFFLNALYELGWKPSDGKAFTLEDLTSLLPNPKEYVKRYITQFIRSLVAAGMLINDLDQQGASNYKFVGVTPTQDEIQAGLQQAAKDSSKYSSRIEHQLLTKTGRHLSQIWLGEVNPLHILFPDDPTKPTAAQLYVERGHWLFPALKEVHTGFVNPIIEERYETQLKTCSSSPPIFRVLEVGAGTGGLTQYFMEECLDSDKPIEYYYTDISASFFSGAESRFEKYSKQMVFRKLNIEEDPLEQGFCPQYFDMVIAYEVLHVGRNVLKTMENLKRLLKPGGIFQFIETTSAHEINTQIFGILEGFWQYEDLDFRPYHITLSPEKWEQVMREIGCDQVVCAPAYNNYNSVVAARLSPEESNLTLVTPSVPQERSQNSWLLFSHEHGAPIAELLKERLVGVDRNVYVVRRPDTCTESEMKELMKSQFKLASKGGNKLEGVIYLWGLSSQTQGESDRDQSQVSLPLINLLQEMTECKVPPRLYVVTQGTANVEGSEVTSPTAATLHGIIKTFSNENTAMHLACLDLAPNDHLHDKQVDSIFQELWSSIKGNRSIAFRDGNRFSAKLISAKVTNNEPLPLPSGCDRFQLVLPSTRLISDLEFGVLENYILGENEVEVQVKAVALNFRDIFSIIKPIAAFDEFNTVGLDFAGVVTKVGPKVKDRKIGDRVIGMNPYWNLSLPSHIKMDEQCLVVLPPHMTFTEGVTFPAVFLTAFYCLIEVAKMKRGETVLIHTASGGVGLCAVQLAKAVGAEIIGTAGSKRKQNYLRNLGIKHVFHSRTTDFHKQIMEVTNGRGVDIVLNSITGEGFKEASLNSLADGGRFIEMSKLNVWKVEEVEKLRPDVFYRIVDLTSLEKPEVQKLIDQLKVFLDTGKIQPIPHERFDAVNIRGALNHLQKAKHIGKIVCVMPEVKIDNSKFISSTPLFNEFSTYLITGGLGGIGLAVVKWMLSSGAKHIALASRSPPKPEIAAQIEAWNKSGHHVEAFAVDIGDYDQCRQLFQELRSPDKGFPQVRGVMHAAGVLSDGIMENQTWDKFNYTYNAKVDGTWNLHDLTKEMLLEHFVLFSSGAATIGSSGQSNHSASNCFQDALAAYRLSVGLPATTVNWGQWGEVGVATEADFPGFRPIATAQGILVLDTFLKTQTSHLSVIIVDSFAMAIKLFPNLKNYVDDKRLFGFYKANIIINSDEFWRDMDSVEDREGKLSKFKDCIKSTLKNILKMDQDEVINDRTDFQSLGVDSLMMLEMKNGLQNILGSRMTLTAAQLKDCSDTHTLANRLVNILLGEGDQSQIVMPTMDELKQLVREDSILPDHVRPSEGMSEVSQIGTVLLTGATGVLGPYLLNELSHRPSIKKIICLIRKIGELSPSERLLKRLKLLNLEGQVDMTKVECIEGDITDDKFGLSDDDYNRLANDIDAIINSAVRADHTAKYYKAPDRSKNDVRSANVKGTLRILEFAVHTKLKHVYHASSLGIVTTTDEEGCLSEDWQDVGVFDDFPINVGYPLSKHISEQLCEQAVKLGIPCKTFRYPLIGGDSKTGQSDYLTNHFMLRRLAYLKLGCMPDMPVPIMIMAVDHCAQISLDLFFNPGAPPDIYNIVHREGSMEQGLIAIADEFGITVEPVSFADFMEKLKQEKDDSPLAPFKSRYEDEEGSVIQNLDANNTAFKSLQKYVEDSSNFFKSRKLPPLIRNYDEMETTEVVMRRDLLYLKESGVFDKFGIK